MRLPPIGPVVLVLSVALIDICQSGQICLSKLCHLNNGKSHSILALVTLLVIDC